MLEHKQSLGQSQSWNTQSSSSINEINKFYLQFTTCKIYSLLFCNAFFSFKESTTGDAILTVTRTQPSEGPLPSNEDSVLFKKI